MGAEKQYVVYGIDGQHYGSDIAVVREVNYLTPITRLPNTPPYVNGVIDLRGEVLPVIDLRKRLGLPPREADSETRIIILDLGARSAAVIVDYVDQVLTVAEDEIVPPDPQMTLPGQDYVTGVVRGKERLVIMMDLVRLMDSAYA